MKEVSLNLSLKIGDKAVEFVHSVPYKKTKQDVLLPFLRKVSQEAEQIAIEKAAANGLTISCQKGCGVCCNQLVPLSIVEARYINTLVERMPKARKKEIHERFAQVYEKLRETEVLDLLMNMSGTGDDGVNLTELGLKYFSYAIPCPFLEDESCSIHKERPLPCREYLVTSTAVHCRNPRKETVNLVEFPVRMSSLVSKLGRPWTRYPHQWVPLSLALQWNKEYPENSALRHSKEWLEDALKMLTN